VGVTKILKRDNNDIEGPVVAWHELDCKPVLCDTESNLIPTTAPIAKVSGSNARTNISRDIEEYVYSLYNESLSNRHH
jgi:hypothetical protein